MLEKCYEGIAVFVMPCMAASIVARTSSCAVKRLETTMAYIILYKFQDPIISEAAS